MWQTVYLYALLALPQREMENRKGEMLALEREVDQLKVLFVCTCLLSEVLLKCGIMYVHTCRILVEEEWKIMELLDNKL